MFWCLKMIHWCSYYQSKVFQHSASSNNIITVIVIETMKLTTLTHQLLQGNNVFFLTLCLQSPHSYLIRKGIKPDREEGRAGGTYFLCFGLSPANPLALQHTDSPMCENDFFNAAMASSECTVSAFLTHIFC